MPDAKDRNLELTMSPLDNDNWSVSVELPDDIGEFGYRYIVRDCDSGNERHEWGAPHRFIPPAKGTGTITLYDHWNDRPEGNPYYSSAFTECICARRHRDGKTIPAKGHVTIRVSAPMVKPDEVLAISGNLPAMGQWDSRHAVRMSGAGYPVWEVNIDVTSLTFPAEYKFLSLKRTLEKFPHGVRTQPDLVYPQVRQSATRGGRGRRAAFQDRRHAVAQVGCGNPGVLPSARRMTSVWATLWT